MSEQKEFSFTTIQGELALDTQQAAQYLGRHYTTLRNILAKHPEIRKYRSGQGNKQFLLKKDLDWLLEHPDELYGSTTEQDGFVEINGRQAMNLTQAAGYMGISAQALRKKLDKYEVKRVRWGADTRKQYVFKNDLDKLKEYREE